MPGPAARRRFEGKVAVVTGAAAGIGRGIALAFAREGAALALLDAEDPAGGAAAQACAAAGAEVLPLRCDVSSDADLAAAAAAVGERFGRADVLVNNAGIQVRGAAERLDPADWDRQIGVNLKGIYLAARRFLPLLRKAAPAAIVNVASVHARGTHGDVPAYAAAKGGAVALTRSLALSCAKDGVRVNAVSPGIIEGTRIFERTLARAKDPEAVRRHRIGLHPAGRLGTPEDVAAAVLFLASDEASFVTGTDLLVDGGLTARLYAEGPE